MTEDEKKQKLNEIAKKMTNAKGKELDKLTAEVDRVIGFDTGDDKYDAERDGQWHVSNGGRSE